jgi:hypothetical protein
MLEERWEGAAVVGPGVGVGATSLCCGGGGYEMFGGWEIVVYLWHAQALSHVHVTHHIPDMIPSSLCAGGIGC